jgi:hypothetical protein
MPPLEQSNLKQNAIVWEPATPNEHGEKVVKKPYLIKSRWEYKERQVLDNNGNTIISEGRVFTQSEIPVGSLIWEGDLTEKPSDSEITNVKEVVSKGKIPDIKARHTQHYVNINAYKESIPLESN